jgi:hypothetical protein
MKFFFAVMDGNLAPQDRKTSHEQCSALFVKAKEKKSRFSGRCPEPHDVWGFAPNSRIKAPPLCAAHLKKVDENSNLPSTSVGACRR